MDNLRNPLAGIIIIITLASLFTSLYSNLQVTYGFTPSATDADNKNVMENIQEITTVAGINKVVSGFGSLFTSNANFVDLVGGLLLLGLGAVQTVLGFFVFPGQFISVITTFYGLPTGVGIGVGALVNTYLWFIVVSAIINRNV